MEILTIICTVIVWVLYHKVFTVYYFSLGQGLLKEFICCLIGGAILASLIVAYWYITVPVLLLIGYGMMKKIKNN